MAKKLNKNLNIRSVISRFKKRGKLGGIEEYLVAFWSRFQNNDINVKDIKSENCLEVDRAKKLELLKIMACIVIDIPDKEKRILRRSGFNQNRNFPIGLSEKEKEIYLLKGNCFICDNQPQHRHHIIQLQNGGRNIHLNIVHLCKSCHKEVHRG